MKWVLALLNAGDSSLSLRHAAYASAVLGGLVWLSYWIAVGPRDANWVAAFGLLLAAVTTGKVVGAKQGSAS